MDTGFECQPRQFNVSLPPPPPPPPPQYSGTSDNGHEKRTTSVEWTNRLPPTDCSIHSVHSEIGATSKQWTRGLSPLCPLFGGSTIHTNHCSSLDVCAFALHFSFSLMYTHRSVYILLHLHTCTLRSGLWIRDSLSTLNIHQSLPAE